MGLAEVLTCIFVVMKLLGYIHWSWWAVFSPELIAIAFYVVIGLLALLGIGLLERISSRR